MAVEVENNRYLFRGRAPRLSKHVAQTLFEGYMRSSSSEPNFSQSSTNSDTERQWSIAKFFQHNALHDYESVWWIGVNTVWWRWPDDETDDSVRQRKQLSTAQNIPRRMSKSWHVLTIRTEQAEHGHDGCLFLNVCSLGTMGIWL